MCSFKSFIIFWVCANCIKQCWVERWLYKGSIHSGGKTELMTCSVFSSTNYKCISCSRTLWEVDRPNWGSSYRLWHVNAPIIAYLTGCVSWYMHIFAYILLPFFYFAELFYSLSRITFLLPFCQSALTLSWPNHQLLPKKWCSPKTLGKVFCGLMRQKVFILVWVLLHLHKTKTAFHSKKTSHQTWWW